MRLSIASLGKLSYKPGLQGNRVRVIAWHVTAAWHILFGGVFSAVHFVTLVIGEKVARAIFAADRFVLYCVARGC